MPSQRRVRIANRFISHKGWLLCVIAVVTFATCAMARPTIAHADAPAVTDFGQDAVKPVMESTWPSNRDAAQAYFITFYPDGHGQVEIRQVRNDAMVTFAGDHPAWHLDHGLMWFMQMPVYVKQVPQLPPPDSYHEAV